MRCYARYTITILGTVLHVVRKVYNIYYTYLYNLNVLLVYYSSGIFIFNCFRSNVVMRALRIKIIGTDASQVFQTRSPVDNYTYCMYLHYSRLGLFHNEVGI